MQGTQFEPDLVLHANRDDDMSAKSTEREQPRRRGWDRRREVGRRIVRDAPRVAIRVYVERRGGTDGRSGSPRRGRAERRTLPPGFRFREREACAGRAGSRRITWN